MLRDIADDLRANDGAALRGADLARARRAAWTTLSAVRARNGAPPNRLEIAAARLAENEEARSSSSRTTEDADIAKTMIEFNSQQAAYQAGLKAGASIVQASLMDFLR